MQSDDGATALIWAARKGHGEIVETLLAKGAAMNLQTGAGATALMMAASKGNVDIVSALLTKGANTKLQVSDGRTALDFAENAAIKKMLTNAATCDLRAAQAALKGLGYYTDVVDGVWGRNSSNAVTEFQTDHELDVTGALGSPTCSRLIQ